MTTESIIYNGDLVGSYKLTALTGTYLYTVNLPDGNESGHTWANTDTSFGIKARWDMADAVFTGDIGSFSDYGNLWLSEVKQGSILPGFDEPSIYNIDSISGLRFQKKISTYT